MLLRVGPYAVVRPLVRGPGAFLAEARGPNEERVLLQMTPLRATEGGDEALARRRLEVDLAGQTAALFKARDVTVMAHGAATRGDGARVLFWALPWRGDAERLGQPALYVEGAEHLLVLARSLAQRVARTHLLGGAEPLLCEQLLAVRATEAEPVGVPVALPPTWLAPEVPSPRWAPEERARGAVARSGDLWRLGQTVRALASAFETVPQGLDRLVAKLCRDDPEGRPPRATEVVVELESIHAALGRGLPLVPLGATPTVSMQSLPTEELAVLLQTAVGHTTCEVAPDPTALLEAGEPTLDEPAEDTLQDLPLGAIDDPPMLDRVPPWAFFFTLDELRSFLKLLAAELERRELEFTFGTGIVRLAPTGGAPSSAPVSYEIGLVPLARACLGETRARWSELVRRELDGLLAATARDPRRRDFRTQAPSDPGAGPTLALPRVEATLRLPAVAAVAAIPRRPRRARWYVAGGLLALLLFVGVLVGARELAARPVRQISIAHRVELRTEPAGALVVAERDGRLLGPAPQRFWVGPEAEAVVLVAAPGHAPERVVLPARGEVRVALEPISPEAPRCALDLPPTERARFEAVGGLLEGGVALRGAAVVRARGPERGAWIVRCDASRIQMRRSEPEPARLELAGGASARLEGRPWREDAREVRRAFSRVEVGGEVRWLVTDASARFVADN